VKEYVSRGAAEGAEILKSGGGMSVIWQCGLESVLSRGECLLCMMWSLTVPINLINLPFLLHNLISAQRNPVPLLNFHMTQPTDFISYYPLCPIKRISNMHFLFLPKCPRKRTPPSSQQGSLWHSCPLLGLFYVSLIFLIKFPLYKQNFPFYQGP